VLVNPGRTITRNSDTWVQTGGLVMCDGLINVINSVYLLEGGYLSGTGVVRSPTTNSGGVVSPGASPGVLTIEGTYTQTAGGSLLIEVGGPIAGSGYDRLVVTSTASLSGTLTAYRIDGYEPNIGDTFDILTATAVTGTFSNIQSPEFSVTYLPSAVRLTYTGPFCDPDYTQDGNADQDDVAYLVNAISGGGNPNGSDLDFNRDGNSDQDDVLALVNLIAGGGCP
jgi:hypothetical protein